MKLGRERETAGLPSLRRYLLHGYPLATLAWCGAVILTWLLSQLAMFTDHLYIGWVLLGFASGAGLAYALITIRKTIKWAREDRIDDYLPTDLHVMRDDANGVLVAVTRRNGDLFYLTMPAGYDIEADNAEAVVKAACPALPITEYRAVNMRQ